MIQSEQNRMKCENRVACTTKYTMSSTVIDVVICVCLLCIPCVEKVRQSEHKNHKKYETRRFCVKYCPKLQKKNISMIHSMNLQIKTRVIFRWTSWITSCHTAYKSDLCVLLGFVFPFYF